MEKISWAIAWEMKKYYLQLPNKKISVYYKMKEG